MADFWKSRNDTIANKEMVGEYALAVLGGVYYTIVPTALHVQGFPALGLALGGLAVAGYLLKSRALILGGLVAGVVHLIYKYGSNLTMQWWGRPIWSLDPEAPPQPGTMGDYTNYPYPTAMNDYMRLPNGYSALALPPADAPGTQVNDYVMPNQTLMDDGDDLGFMSRQRYEQNGGGYDAPSMFD